MASIHGLFGTNGIRGKVNSELSPNFISNVSMAIGTWANKNSKIILGTDTRIHGLFIKNIVSGTLLSMGHNIIDAGILPTPALQLGTQKYADLGIMVTASHNPPEYNGIKIISSDGTEIDESSENAIEEIFLSKKFKEHPWFLIGDYEKIDIKGDYIFRILSLIKRENIRKMHVLLDCSNGSSFETSPEILKRLGISFETINCQPDGTFPSHLPEPKEENLGMLIRLVKDNYDIGIAHDGDADRVMFVDENGVFLSGDKALAIFTLEKVKKKKGIIVVPVSASMAIEEIAEKFGSRVLYTKVGAPIVARKMMEIGAIFGGEDNGGFIFPEMQYCRDGAMAMAKMLEILSLDKISLSEKLKEIPEYYNVKGNVNVEKEKIPKIMKNLENISEGKNIIKIDGIKIIEGKSWVLIRPSGTEPLIRIYSEANDKNTAQKVFMEYKNLIESLIKEI
ncbi:MAG: phosphoglucosamine mutase [Thermoplasmata archaeon]